MKKNEIFKSQLNNGRLEEAKDFPRVLLIDSISYCNLKCSMCVHPKMTRKKGIMPWNIFTKIINEIAEVDKNVRVWMVFFGEALILKKKKPTIFDMIAYAKMKGLSDVVLNSNANLLDDECALKLINSGLDAIYIGIDAFNSETYDKLRIGGNYAKTVANVLNLIKLRNRTKLKKPEVVVQFVEMDLNTHEKDNFSKFWSEQGAIVKIRPKVSWGNLMDAPNLILDNKERWPCHWAMQTMSIADDGRVVLCPVDLDARVVVGDIKNSSIREVWNGKLKEFRRFHNNHEFHLLPPMCKDCRDWQAAMAEYYKDGVNI
jgi:radical SAM protein with 4Fe4S-binding SPASM domain